MGREESLKCKIKNAKLQLKIKSWDSYGWQIVFCVSFPIACLPAGREAVFSVPGRESHGCLLNG